MNDESKVPLGIGDTVRFSEIKVASRKGLMKRAVEVYIEKRAEKKEDKNDKLEKPVHGKIGKGEEDKKDKPNDKRNEQVALLFKALGCFPSLFYSVDMHRPTCFFPN